MSHFSIIDDRLICIRVLENFGEKISVRDAYFAKDHAHPAWREVSREEWLSMKEKLEA
jgi:hypothetical protein